jgi:hypothetical protein
MSVNLKMLASAAAVAVGVFAACPTARAADIAVPASVAPASAAVQQQSRPNSILVFGGLMSTTSLYDTVLLNLDSGAGIYPHYDNTIAGIAYDRDILPLGYGFDLGIEIGVADRFGHYRDCCFTVIKSSRLVQSGELWGGVRLRQEGILLFDQLRIGAAVTFGLSGATASIGAEYGHEIENGGDASVLYYFGPELDFSSPSLPALEFVLKLQHRSGGQNVSVLPTLGNMAEGYNASVAGLLYRF